jgi:hypothetical protein
VHLHVSTKHDARFCRLQVTSHRSDLLAVDIAVASRPAFIVRYMRPDKKLKGFPKGGAPFLTKCYASCLGPCAYGEVCCQPTAQTQRPHPPRCLKRLLLGGVQVEEWLKPTESAGSEKWLYCDCLMSPCMMCVCPLKIKKSDEQRQRVEAKIHAFHQQMVCTHMCLGRVRVR